MGHDRYPTTTGWFGSGRRDTSHLWAGITLEHDARRAGMDTAWFEGPGGHGFQFCTWAIRRLLPELFDRMDPHAWPVASDRRGPTGVVAKAGPPGGLTTHQK